MQTFTTTMRTVGIRKQRVYFFLENDTLCCIIQSLNSCYFVLLCDAVPGNGVARVLTVMILPPIQTYPFLVFFISGSA